MTSLLTVQKQMSAEIGYFIPLADLTNKIYWHVDVAGSTGVGGGTFSTALWASPTGGQACSSINVAGKALLRDMGRTIVSSLRTFRKIQLVAPAGGVLSTLSTFGVGGRSGTGVGGSGEDYYTGYIELGFEGNGNPAPVAHFGR
jgi:hypothetical protein